MAAARSSGAADALTEALAEALRRVMRGEVDATGLTRGIYSSDASNYRVVPRVVVFPRDELDVAAAGDVARQFDVPVTMRGAGTSCAGNAVGPGIVVATGRHLNRVLDIDVTGRLARVQPGVVLDSLQRALKPHGLRFGPDPATHSRCTIGGMIGDNACGSHSVAYGRTADNVQAITAIDGRGRRVEARAGAVAQVPGLTELVARAAPVIRAEFGRFGRQVSGYGLEHLLDENGADLAKALVGSEGTLALVTAATLRLTPTPRQPSLVVLGYATLAEAADSVPAILPHRPLTLEGLDARLVGAYERQVGPAPELPAGGAWLMVEVEDPGTAGAVRRDAGALDGIVLPDGPLSRALWRIREDGAGFAGRTPSGREGHVGFEDAAVPPARLGAYLRQFEDLLADAGLGGIAYGHFGEGCVHIRIDFPLARGTRVFREFIEAAGALVARHGGSLSGEHGDGRARSQLLGLMFSPAAIDVMRQVKGLFDPLGLLGPGVIVASDEGAAEAGRPGASPGGEAGGEAGGDAGGEAGGVAGRGPRAAGRGRVAPIDADMRRPAARPTPARGGFAFAADRGDLTGAAHRCVGLAKCVTATSPFMCPSYLATGQDKDSPRGRARVLQEALNGHLIGPGLAAPELAEALELCLGCKACSRDCPAAVDMARLKAEVLCRRFSGRIRPRTHYLLGWLPRWAALAGRMPAAANLAPRAPILGKLLLRAGGLDPRRSLPRLAREPLSVRAAAQGVPTAQDSADLAADAPHGPGPVLVWADSFSSHMAVEAAEAAVRVLTAAGHTVHLVPPGACCGLTWISTGQLRGAKRRLRALLDVLGPFAVNGVPIVGVEPSCVAVLRSDLVDLLPNDPRAAAVARAAKTLAEVLVTDLAEGWTPPSLAGVQVVAQPHCHHHAVMGWDADRQLLAALGAEVGELRGCCGMAGGFGLERGHYEVSVKVAQRSLLPALAEAPDAVFLADGFSCRAQAADLAGREGIHLAQLIAERLPDAV
jgi:FAD/FMN-containing dehydrogenase/Fe-S oxidoreductase